MGWIVLGIAVGMSHALTLRRQARRDVGRSAPAIRAFVIATVLTAAALGHHLATTFSAWLVTFVLAAVTLQIRWSAP
jgi:hypothetical protein